MTAEKVRTFNPMTEARLGDMTVTRDTAGKAKALKFFVRTSKCDLGRRGVTVEC